jgi:L-cystine transport system permease protein
MELDYKFMRDMFFMSLKGIPVTFQITLVALVYAVPMGFFIAIICVNKVPVLSRIFKVYISFIRGTPFILQIFLVYHSLPSLLAYLFKKFEIGYNIFDINNIVYAFVVFAFSEAAILAEVFRSALLTVDKGQLEAAQAVGLTKAQGYVRIVVPQALTASIPVFCNSTTSLIKATSLAFSMSVMEITSIAKIEGGISAAWIEAYLVIAAVYFVLIFTVEKGFKLFEKHMVVYKGVSENA